MRKLSLFSVALLLTLTLPTVFAKPHYYHPTVTFTGNIVSEEVEMEAWPEPPSSKIVIEWEPIDLMFQDRGEEEKNDDYKKGFSWNYFQGPHACALYLRVFKHKGEARVIECYFERNGDFQFVLKGSGTWYDDSGTDTISCEGESFTIYELSYIGQKGKIKYDWRWEGLLTFTITIE